MGRDQTFVDLGPSTLVMLQRGRIAIAGFPRSAGPGRVHAHSRHRGTRPYGPRNLGDLVDNLQEAADLSVWGGGVDGNLVGDASAAPLVVELTVHRHVRAAYLETETMRLPVEVIQHTYCDRQMEHLCAVRRRAGNHPSIGPRMLEDDTVDWAQSARTCPNSEGRKLHPGIVAHT